MIDVFAFDRPADPDKGVFGIGFAIGELADGGPARNPLLDLSYNGAGLSHGRNVLAGADYLFDGAGGKIGFRVPPLSG
jgi:hypothetical protein